jgi:hypothetical protein
VPPVWIAIPSAVAGSSCINPIAPDFDSTVARNLLSW